MVHVLAHYNSVAQFIPGGLKKKKNYNLVRNRSKNKSSGMLVRYENQFLFLFGSTVIYRLYIIRKVDYVDISSFFHYPVDSCYY